MYALTTYITNRFNSAAVMLVYILRDTTYVPQLDNVQGNERTFLHMLFDLSTSRQSDPFDPKPFILKLIENVNDTNPNEQRTRAVVRRNAGSDPIPQLLDQDQEVI